MEPLASTLISPYKASVNPCLTLQTVLSPQAQGEASWSCTEGRTAKILMKFLRLMAWEGAWKFPSLQIACWKADTLSIHTLRTYLLLAVRDSLLCGAAPPVKSLPAPPPLHPAL